tara:strand:- start:382 stop:1095 length:714 start_codon:yes stop_codon:yes gene_type:complete
MKTLITAIAVVLSATAAFAQTPNNYINTTENGVIREIDHGGENYNHGNKPIISRDMATQKELNTVQGAIGLVLKDQGAMIQNNANDIANNASEIYRVDQEDHRVVNATVNEDGFLVLHSADMDGGTERAKVTEVNIAASTNGADGADGANGSDGSKGDKGAAGKNAIAPLGSLSFSSASSSFTGSGMGFGLSASNYSSLEGSIVIGVDFADNWRVVGGVTTDFNNRHAVSAGVGFSF